MFLLLLFGIFACSSENGNVANSSGSAIKPFPEPKIPFSPKQYVCYKTNIPIDIDGKMKEPVWQKAEWTDDFVDIEGALKPKPRFRTRSKMLWDDRYFYVVADITESDVWATLKKRDSVIYHDNDFEVFIDPNGDTHRYYELEINAFNTEWDLFLDKPYRDDNRIMFFWDIGGLKSAVHVKGTINTPGDTDKSWTLEIAIPWDVLKECADKPAPPKSGDQWRINFSRVEWKVSVENGNYMKVKNPKTEKPLPEDNWVWSPQGIINMHYPEMWGFVQFSGKTAGTGTDSFISNPEEAVKWALRQVYYREKTYFLEHGKYCEKYSRFGLDDRQFKNYIWPPEIYITPSLFEVIAKSKNGGKSWHITQDGRVWQE
ncbi:MAG TPA: carbohydrate-binding family 9-like protein [Bacteroidetes bacterium]|nr:carbohydrate-binding family 9-like protein [Bacteroidota bacterium]